MDPTYTIPGPTLVSDSSSITAMANISISINIEKSLSKVTVNTISNSAGTFMKHANILYFIVKET